MMTGAGWKGFVERDMMGHTWLLTHCVPSSPLSLSLGKPNQLISERYTPLFVFLHLSISLFYLRPCQQPPVLVPRLGGVRILSLFQFHLLAPI